MIDLLLLGTLDPDPVRVREACERVFAVRAQQPWPPVLTAPPSWSGPCAAMASSLQFPVADVHEAGLFVQAHIDRIVGHREDLA